MNIAVVTSYYERPEEMLKLGLSVSASARRSGFDVTHYVLDDGSKEFPLVGQDFQLHKNYKAECFRQEPNMGRDGYWQTVENTLRLARGKGYDIVIHLDDDVYVCKDFFEIAVRAWERHGQYSMFNLFRDRRITDRHRGMPPQLLDGMCLIPTILLDKIDWKVEPQKPGNGSTGVWRQLSRRLLDAHPDAKVYYFTHSLTWHMGTSADKSKLNKADRAIEPMETVMFADHGGDKPKVIDPVNGIECRDEGKWLYCVYEGIGNCVIPYFGLLRLLAHNRNIDVYCQNEKARVFYRKICGVYNLQFFNEKPNPSYYERVFNMNRQGMPNVVGDHAKVQAVLDRHGMNADQAGSGYREVTPFEWNAFICGSYDVLICAGSLDVDGKWLRKRYRRWPEVVEILKSWGYSVACIGGPRDYVYGAEDEIGLSMHASINLINSCGVFVSNCTGPAHIAEAIGKRHIVVGTASSPKKNWDPAFNRYTTYISKGCECQQDDGIMGQKWKDCVTWECCYIDPMIIAKEVRNALDSGN